MALPRLLDSRRVRRLLGLALAAKGLVGVLAPRLTARVVTRVSLREVYANPGDLEPRDTYVELVRNASAGVLVFGALTAVRAGSRGDADADDSAEAGVTDTGAGAAADADADATAGADADTDTTADATVDDTGIDTDTGSGSSSDSSAGRGD